MRVGQPGPVRITSQHYSGVTVIGIIILIAVFSIGLGCGVSSGAGGGALSLVPEETTEITVWDVEETLGGDAPERLVDELEQEFEDWLDELGIRFTDLKTIVVTEDGSLYLLDGDVDLEIVRDALDDAEYDDREYQGYEIWDRDYGRARSLALVEQSGPLVLGDQEEVKDVLRALKRESPFLFDNRDSELVRVFNKAGK